MEICNRFKIENKYLDIVERLFLFFFFIYSFMGHNSFTYGHKIITYVMWPVFLLGGLLILYRMLYYKNYYKMPGALLLLFILVSIGVSIVMNYQYAFKRNIMFALYWVLYFVLLYIQREDQTPEELRKKFEFVATLFVIYMTIGVIISYVLMLTGYNGVFHASEGNYEYRLGFSIGRLWGVFTDPNHASFSAGVAAAFLLYFIARSKKMIVRILYGVDIFSFLFYITLADSRSGAISIGIIAGVFAFTLLWHRAKDQKWIFKVLALFISAAVLLCGYYIPRLLKDVYNQIIISTAAPKESGTPGTATQEPDFVIERGYDLSKDFSNRRFDLWKSAVEIYVSSPKTILLGTSFCGMVPYAQENLPNTYMVNNGHLVFETAHNEFFNILAAQGTLGILTVGAFAVFVLVFIIKYLFRLKREYILLAATLLAVVVALAGDTVFYPIMFYNFSQNAFIFWFSLGGLIFILKQGRETQHDRISD